MTVAQSLDLAASLYLSAAGRTQPVMGLDPVPAPSEVTPGWLGFGFFVTLCVVTVLLWFNMRKQLKKIDFDDGSGRRGLADTRDAAHGPGDSPAAADVDTPAEPPAPDRP